jgi:hypothetical protein
VFTACGIKPAGSLDAVFHRIQTTEYLHAMLLSDTKFRGNRYTNLQAPCVLYKGQEFRYSPENAFYIFNQQIYSLSDICLTVHH